ncbi:MAG: hypothetical protein ACRBBP_05135 [Bdellovibrionales bacterium]
MIFSFSAEAANWGIFKPRSESRGRNSAAQTEGRVEHCTTGTCGTNNFRSPALARMPAAEGLGVGMQRTLTNLYGTCAAAESLNSISIDSQGNHKRYALLKPGEPAGAGDRLIPGISPSTIDAGFDNIRAVNPNRNPMGPYAAAARGARTCTNTVDVNGQQVRPSQVHKIFGNGAAGRMVNGDFNSFSCGSSNYLNSLTTVQRAFRCGLEENSQPAITLDCAELIGASAIASCKKLHPDQTIDGQGIRMGGSLLSTRTLSNNRCLRTPTVSAANPIASGDIFVVETHSFVITQVGVDPFGIDAAIREGGCDNINSNDLNFSFGQSSSSREMGPVQTTARAYSSLRYGDGFGLNAFPLGSIVAMARTLCKKQRGGRTSGPSTKYIEHSGVRQLRHNSASAACSYPEGQCPKSAGSECSEQCGV